MDNLQAARNIFSVASLLESLGGNRYRVWAYRRAAVGLLRLPDAAVAYTNERGELVLPWLGERLRRKLGELVTHGRMQFEDELLAECPPEVRTLLSVPGVGPKTARRLITELGVRSLDDLARAARAGELQKLRGFGPRREQQLGAAAELLLDQAA
jgi:DNA polymerase (family 10)